MLKILIVDNNEDKVNKIRSVVSEVTCIKTDDIKVAVDQVQCREIIKKEQFDVMILDINFSERFGDAAKRNAGVEIIEEIKASIAVKKPLYIIGLTQYEDLQKEYSHSFDEIFMKILHFKLGDEKWEIQLKNILKYACDAKSIVVSQSTTSSNLADLCIVTALPNPELKQVLALNGDWQRLPLENDNVIYYRGYFKNSAKTLSVYTASCNQMGMTASSCLATSMIRRFRPRYIAICGIAAGTVEKSDFGDVLVADSSFDYGSGKIVVDKNKKSVFLPDPKDIPLDSTLKSLFLNCQMNRLFLNDIKDKGPSPKPKTSLNLHVGPFASGSAVVDNESVIEEIKIHKRKLIGIDMETYGIFYAAMNAGTPQPKPIAIKAISDFALNKKDIYQEYAAFTSANYLYQFALEYL